MIIDTHAHLDGEEFRDDAAAVVERARAAGIGKVFVPAIDLNSVATVTAFCSRFPGFAYPMIGLHPEEVRADYADVIGKMRSMLDERFIAIGEVGLDFYWSREFEKEQLAAFEMQVGWAAEQRLPLMIHCRKAQAELVAILRRYERDLVGGVFHCFTGNAREAAELLRFDKFVLGIGGVLTFKKSKLPEVLPEVPADRVVVETDAPYMAPVPKRGERNESAYVALVVERMAQCYGLTPEEMAATTTANAMRVFGMV